MRPPGRALSPAAPRGVRRPPDPRGDRFRVERVDEDRSPVGDLGRGGPDARHDRRPGGHRLEDGQAEALVEGRVDEGRGAPVEPRELLVVDVAERMNVHLAPARRARDPKLHAHESSRFGEAGEVLPRLDRPDGEDVLALRLRALRREGRLDAVRDHPNPAFVDAEQLDRLAGRELRDRDHPRRRPRQSGQNEPAVEPRPAVEGLGMAKHSQVVDREHQRDARAERPSVPGAVEDVDAVASRTSRQRPQVPDGVADDLARPRGAGEGVAAHVDSLELGEQLPQVARRPRAGQLERGDVDADAKLSHAHTPAASPHRRPAT